MPWNMELFRPEAEVSVFCPPIPPLEKRYNGVRRPHCLRFSSGEGIARNRNFMLIGRKRKIAFELFWSELGFLDW